MRLLATSQLEISSLATATSGAHRSPVVSRAPHVHLGFAPDQLALGGSFVDVIGQAHHDGTPLRVVDLSRHRVIAHRRLPGCVHAARLGGGNLAVLSVRQNCGKTRHQSNRLRLLNPTTLATRHSRTLGAAQDVLARSEGVYVSRPAVIDVLTTD